MNHSTLYLTLVASVSFLTVLTGNPKKVLEWPNDRLLPIAVSEASITLDGLPLHITKFSSKAAEIHTTNTRPWRRHHGLYFRNSSVGFIHEKNSKIKVGISVIRSESWIKSLSTETLNDYVNGLRIKYPERFTLLDESKEFGPIPKTGYLLGSPYRIVHYRVEPIDKNADPIEIRDIFLQKGDHTFVLSFEAPEKLAERNFETAFEFMFSLEISMGSGG